MALSSTPPPLFERVPSGVAGLDIILGGGFIRGGLYIIQGAPGAGKTILTNQLCFNYIVNHSGSCAIFVTLLAENHARMVSNLRGMRFFDEAQIPDRMTYLSARDALREEGLQGLTDLLRREVQRRRCSILVLDGLVSAQAHSETDQIFKEFVHSLQEIALATNCTMFLTTNTVERLASPEQTMVDGLIDLNDRGYGWRSQSDLQVRKFRGSAFLRGRHAYQITDTGINVFPRIEALYAQPSRPDHGRRGRISSGVSRVDELTSGGLPVDSTTLLVGPSGVGKTTFGLQFLASASATEPGLLFGFYETPARIRAKAEQLCKPLLAHLESGTVELLWQPPTEDYLDARGARLLEAVQRRQVKRLVVDGLLGFHKAAVEPSRLDHFFTALGNELRVLGVTSLYTLEATSIQHGAIKAPIGDISSLAENVIVMRYKEKSAQLYRLMSIWKVRDSPCDSAMHEFSISSDGLLVSINSESAEQIMSGLQAGAEGVALVPNASFLATGGL